MELEQLKNTKQMFDLVGALLGAGLFAGQDSTHVTQARNFIEQLKGNINEQIANRAVSSVQPSTDEVGVADSGVSDSGRQNTKRKKK